MAINTKKRDRLTMATPSSHCEPSQTATVDDGDGEEYERAVAFLRDFHSRRVAATATCLHSTALDAILEADRLDEVLSSEFSLALSVGRRPPLSSSNSKPVENEKSESFLNIIADAPSPGPSLSRANRMRRTGGLTRMKKTATSKCLLELDVDSSSSDSKPTGSFGGGPRPVSPSLASLDSSGYFLDHDEASPASKRRRS